VNCAALSEELLESELFGHEKGAFTGALRTHKGRFERAHGGTLFLDEIGDMPLRIQAKLLRVLEAGVIERVGGEQEIHTDVRLEAATNVPLELAVQDGTFRADLYHRLAVLRLHLPPLRERREDIPILVAHFLQALNQRYQRHVQRLTPEALAVLAEYPWPGNVRELRNVLERVYIEATTSVIGASAFEEWAYEQSQYFSNFWRPERTQHPLTPSTALMTPYAGVYRALPPGPGAAAHAPPIDVAPESFTYLDHAPSPPAASRAAYPQGGPRALTQQRLVQAYRQAAGNITEAARLLGVHRATLYRRLKRFGITRDDLEDEAPWPSLPNASGHGQASGVPSQEETHES
jgi:sigma-54 specific flagellar transcriptional regulator A